MRTNINIINEQAQKIYSVLPDNAGFSPNDVLQMCRRAKINIEYEQIRSRLDRLAAQNLIEKIGRGKFIKTKSKFDDISKADLTDYTILELVAELKSRGNFKITQIREIEL